MTKRFLILLLISLCRLASAQLPVSPVKSLEHISLLERRSFKNFPSSVPVFNYDVVYHCCEWQIDPAVNYIRGKITTFFKPTAAGFDTLVFTLSDTLRVDSVRYHNNSLAFNHSGNLLALPLPAVIPPGTLDSVSVFYQGAPDSTGYGAFTQSTHNGVPVIWTLSEPFGASDWWPCKNGLTDKADSLDVIITTPKAYRAASNGLLVSVINSGANKIYHWKHRYPIATYLVCLAVTNYAEYFASVPFKSTNLMEQTFVYPEDSASIATQTPDDIPIMQLYDSLFGVYPFIKEKYGHVEAGLTMEHQTMTFFGTNSFGFETLAHELAHHWFGDDVTCASWHEIWLNEGLATYLSGLAYEHLLNGVWWMPFKRTRIDAITSQPDGSLWCNDTTKLERIFDSRLSYAKGAMILHQLRWIFGDSVFFAALNNYLKDPTLAYGFAHTSDLQRHFELASGQNLNWYFNDWYTGQGFPSYQISWEQTGNTVNLTVNQTQSDPSVSFFALPLPVEFKNQTRDTLIRLQHNFSGQSFSVAIPFAVDSVKLDPDLWLISANNTVTPVNEMNLDPFISIYPNPASDEVKITFSKRFAKLQIQVTDAAGKVIREISANNSDAVTLPVKTLSRGFYFLKFNSGDQSCTRKIAIQ